MVKGWKTFDYSAPPSTEGQYLGYCPGRRGVLCLFHIDYQNKKPYFFDGRFDVQLEGLTHYKLIKAPKL